jgi:hypothetical protein
VFALLEDAEKAIGELQRKDAGGRKPKVVRCCGFCKSPPLPLHGVDEDIYVPRMPRHVELATCGTRYHRMY